MEKVLIVLTLMMNFTNVDSQGFSAYIKKNAMKINKLDSLDRSAYTLLKNFQLIMIGEMHGTNEPANLVFGVATLFANTNDTIQVGFEIPSDQMIAYQKALTGSSVFQSDFFTQNSNDGRASLAWATTISRLSYYPRIKVFFYDLNKAQSNSGQDRDSIMYLNIKHSLTEHPNWRTITLSGNIHNKRLPHNTNKTTAYFLCNDSQLNMAEKTCTLNHRFQEGTMLNNIGNGLELRQVNNLPSDFSESVEVENYLLLYPSPNAYNGIFFSRKVTASELINKK